jgi:hypothetical protein
MQPSENVSRLKANRLFTVLGCASVESLQHLFMRQDALQNRAAPDLVRQLFLRHDAIFILIRGIEKISVSPGEFA